MATQKINIYIYAPDKSMIAKMEESYVPLKLYHNGMLIYILWEKEEMSLIWTLIYLLRLEELGLVLIHLQCLIN